MDDVQRLEAKWSVPVVVENRSGAGGNSGAAAVARATPDGHTLLQAGSPQFAVNVTLCKSLPYNPVYDFIPLAMAAATPFVLVVNPKAPAKTVAEFVAYAKSQPQPLIYATAGFRVPHHLYTELLKSMTGVNMTPTPCVPAGDLHGVPPFVLVLAACGMFAAGIVGALHIHARVVEIGAPGE